MSPNVMGVPVQMPSQMMVIGLGTAVTAAASYVVYRHFAANDGTSPFQEVAKINSIFIYPVKSLPPIEIPEAFITLTGMTYKDLQDREFMLVNPENKFVTGRDEPSLLLLHLDYKEKEKCLEITSRNPGIPMEPLVLSLDAQLVEMTSPELVTVRTWKPHHAYKALPLAKASAWFCKYLNRDVKLVRFIERVNERRREVPDRFHDSKELSYLSEQSVNNLNDLISDPTANVSHRNFRPSLLVDTKVPFEEDCWGTVRIGDLETEFFSRCERCVFTTVNPDTGVKNVKEPLHTLRKYRVDRSDEGVKKHQLRPLMASLHIIKRPGTIKAGQIIQARRAPRAII